MSSVEMSPVLAQMQALNAKTRLINQDNAAPKADFGELLQQSVEMVSRTQSDATALKRSFQSGDAGVELPEVMIAVQKASLSFEAMKQVRNQLLTAYKDISSMQV